MSPFICHCCVFQLRLFITRQLVLEPLSYDLFIFLHAPRRVTSNRMLIHSLRPAKIQTVRHQTISSIYQMNHFIYSLNKRLILDNCSSYAGDLNVTINDDNKWMKIYPHILYSASNDGISCLSIRIQFNALNVLVTL